MDAVISRGGDILDIRDAAYLLRLHPAHVLSMLERCDMPARKIGGEWRFEKQALQTWLAEGSSGRANPLHYRLTPFNLKARPEVASWLI